LVRAGLQRFLSDRWGEVEVGEVRPASAGARRLNVLFDAVRDGETLELAATVMPTSAIQIVSIDIEASSLRLAEEAGVPVPHVHAVCTDNCYLGGPFFVSSRVPGISVGRQVLRLVGATPGLGARLGRQCGEALARLHAAPTEAAHPDLKRPEETGTVASSLARIYGELESLLQPSPTFTLAYKWLERHRPTDPPRLTLVHGDFRHGNLLVTVSGLEAVLDWEGAHLGDGLEDLAWICQRMWRFRSDELEVGGFANRSDLREGYEVGGGVWKDDAFLRWKVYGSLRWGIGLAKQSMQHLDRSFRSVIMAGSGRRVAEMEYDLLMLVRAGNAE